VQILRARPGGVALDRSVLVEEVQVRCAYLGKGQSGAAGELLAGAAVAPYAGGGERGGVVGDALAEAAASEGYGGLGLLVGHDIIL